jgi:hypothetical protein
LAEITPLERWEMSQPGNVLRVFERGGGPKGEVGEPVREDDAGKPDDKLGTRGFGTQLRTDPVFLGLQKTRLLDPLLSMPGTNDQPGDYRASGCTACHVVYANDRSAEHSAQYAAFGNRGFSASKDPTIPHDEPEAVIGSDLQRMAYPDDFRTHVERKRELTTAYHHPGNVFDVQLRGEYAYAALGPGGFRVFDVANIDNKGFSERMVTAPVSPLGQRLYVKTRFATAVATPTTLTVDPLRTQNPENEEQKIHLLYGFLYVTDKYEGLIVAGNPDLKGKNPGVGTLLDGNPRNNFISRAATFNPGGALAGARRITIAGTYAYILCDRVLVVVDLDNPLEPRVTAEIGAPDLAEPQGVAVQFRYGFVVDRDGLKALDVTDLAHPRVVPGAFVPIGDARNVAVSRTDAYVSAGKNGVALVNVEQPEHPRPEQMFTADGAR